LATYIGERRTTFAKAYGIKVRCYWELFGEHVGNLGTLWGTCQELGNSLGNMSGTWELFGEHVGNLGTLWGNMSGTWELFGEHVGNLGTLCFDPSPTPE